MNRIHTECRVTRLLSCSRVRRATIAALAGLAFAFLAACGGGGSSSAAPATDTAPAAASDTLTVTSGYDPVTASDGTTYGDGGGDGSGGGGGGGGGGSGGAAGGAAGGGAGAGGDGGAFVGALVTVTRADGSATASALTDRYGMVTVRNGGNTQPLLFTLQGGANATYWDEAKQAMLPYPATQTMHAMVAATGGGQTLGKNVGITPLTEAAYQYAVTNLGGHDAWKNAANVATANLAIATEFNRFLPSTEAIDDITRLATPARDATTQVFAASSPNNTYGLVIAGLVRQSIVHNQGSPAPGIDLVNQLALDLSDGKFDGVGPGNVPVAPSSTQQAYVFATVTADALAGQTQIAAINAVANPVTSYALGGSVSGLAADGLVLADGGSLVTVPSDAASFSFGAVLLSGSSYAVTVQAQPTDGSVCIVTNGSGTAGAADVTSPAVNCVAPMFTLGGSISGLTADGLVLADGSATVAVPAGATSFSFGAMLVAGSGYDITVQTQPTGLACVVSGGSGTSGSADVTTPVVSCVVPQHALGGSVAGLTAGGLVLADGGATVQVASGATSFTFGAILQAGLAYNVTVQTQPTGLNCTVSNGSGMAPSADVTTPSVTCAVLQYVLGGSVSGLTAGGLVLQNGNALINVAANASTFSFGAVLQQGNTYNVIVQAQPDGLNCTVSNGSGTTGTANVTTPVVACVPQQYTLGGSVSGLTATGLVLANGRATIGVLANASAFTFGTVLQQGTTYNITVQTQPTGLTCTVANGSGTTGTVNVTTPAVTCAPQRFTLGGSVSGLTVNGQAISGLVLQNGNTLLNVPAGATSFSFGAVLQFGDSYDVVVNTSPAGLTCSVANGSARLVTGNITTPIVSCSLLIL